MQRMRSERAQGTLEYVLVLVIILLAIIAGSASVKKSVSDNTFEASKGRITTAAKHLADQK